MPGYFQLPDDSNITAKQNLRPTDVMPDIGGATNLGAAGGAMAAGGAAMGGTVGQTVAGAGAGVGLGALLGIGGPAGAAVGGGLALVSGLLQAAAERRRRAGEIEANKAQQNSNAISRNGDQSAATMRSLLGAI